MTPGNWIGSEWIQEDGALVGTHWRHPTACGIQDREVAPDIRAWDMSQPGRALNTFLERPWTAGYGTCS